jgi:hypothetical protein
VRRVMRAMAVQVRRPVADDFHNAIVA